jgi:hypothetical protein
MHEEVFFAGRLSGTSTYQPFWDPELVEFLIRVPPPARSRNGMAKALLREPLHRRFPELSFERQRKSNLGGPLATVLSKQLAGVAKTVGGPQALARAGVVDANRAIDFIREAIAGPSAQRKAWAWEILNLEAWARANSG